MGCTGGTISHIVLKIHPHRIVIDSREFEPYQKRAGQIVYRLPRSLDQLNEATPLAHLCRWSSESTTPALRFRAVLIDNTDVEVELTKV